LRRRRGRLDEGMNDLKREASRADKQIKTLSMNLHRDKEKGRKILKGG